MPIVRVNMFEGRSSEQKRRLVRDITATVADVCGVSPATVHVLIEEVARENWGRGSVLNADRGNRPKAPVDELTFFSVSDVITVPERREEYLAYRKDSVHPTMATMPGYQGSFVGQDIEDENHFILLIRWHDLESRSNYQRSQEHDQLRDKIRGELTTRMEISSYVRMDLTHGGGLAHQDPTPSFLRVATHRIEPAKENAYFELRRLEVHPNMAAFDGFMSTTVLRSLDNEGAYLVVDQWSTRDAADAYQQSELCEALDFQTRSLLTGDPDVLQYQVLDL